jgi:flavin reductase (DIM6/NTAB) family NADH-FMN oxidoreductase RutF
MTMLSLPLDSEASDPRLLRQALGRFATGVTVITTRGPDGKYEGLTANSFSAVSLDPPLVLWSLRLAAPSLASFKEAGYFVVNVLSTAQSEVSRHFATPAHDKFEDVEFSTVSAGAPCSTRVSRSSSAGPRAASRAGTMSSSSAALSRPITGTASR